MQRTKQILCDLINIDSTFDREAAIGAYVQELFEDQGYRVTTQPVPLVSPTPEAEPRFNLLIERGEPTLYFFGHLDTVNPVAGSGQRWTHPPLRATEASGQLYGLGAVDMKGGIAAFLAAVLARQPDNVGVCLTCDEEGKFSGVRALLEQDTFRRRQPRLAIFAEPTDLRIVNTHRGCLEIVFEATGRAAHAAAPELGIDASQLFGCMAELEGWLHAEFPGSSFNLGYFQAGRRDAINVVPDHATAIVDIRPSAALQARGAECVLERATELSSQRELGMEHRVQIDMKPLAVRPEEVEPLAAAVAAAGLDVEYRDLGGTSEAGQLHHRYGFPCVNFGPGPQGLSHQADEHVDLDSLARCREVFDHLIDACG